jgi:cysteine-rich repeat protein
VRPQARVHKPGARLPLNSQIMRRSDRAEASAPALAVPRDRIIRAFFFPVCILGAVTCGGGDEAPAAGGKSGGGLGSGGSSGTVGSSGRGGTSGSGGSSGLGGSSGTDAGGGVTSGGSSGAAGASGAGTGGGGTGGATPLCGNGGPDPGEECDTGGVSETCDADCTRATCGDGAVNARAHEECDTGGATPSCDADCTFVACGDGTVHSGAGEHCDSGSETASCDVDCTPPECGDGVTNAEAGEACDDGNKTGGDGCSTSCAFERADTGGDTCANAIALSLGTNPVSYSASAKNYLLWRPTCVQGEPSGPDVVLSYTATFTGTLEVTLAKADSRPWVGVVNQGVCGDTSAPIACMARLPTTSMVERVPVVNGRTYYFYISKTGTDVTPLSNPFSVTLTRLAAETGENCGNPIPVTLGENSVSWTASQRDHFYQPPACASGASLDGPDVVLSYTSAFEGFVQFKIEKPEATRWVAVATGGQACGGLSNSLACVSSQSGTSLSGLIDVSAAFNAQTGMKSRHFLVADTTLGANPLSNPLKVTLTGMDEHGGTGESCSTPGKRISLGTNTVRWIGTANDHLTATPSCAAGHAVRGPDVVFEYDAPTSGTLSVTINKPAGTRWVAVVGDYACGNISQPLACLSDFSNTSMKGKLQVTAGYKYLLYVAATDEGTIPLQVPLTITLSQ